eukprot:2718971-Rhodomonas_salina.5
MTMTVAMTMTLIRDNDDGNNDGDDDNDNDNDNDNDDDDDDDADNHAGEQLQEKDEEALNLRVFAVFDTGKGSAAAACGMLLRTRHPADMPRIAHAMSKLASAMLSRIARAMSRADTRVGCAARSLRWRRRGRRGCESSKRSCAGNS